MSKSNVHFIFLKFNRKNNTIHLVFTFDEEKSNNISISSPIEKINLIKDYKFKSEYEIITKSKSHYIIQITHEIVNKYIKELEIFKKLMKN